MNDRVSVLTGELVAGACALFTLCTDDEIVNWSST